MKRHALIFGGVGGLLIVVLQLTQYRFLVIEHSVEVYSALIAALFACVGIWLGSRLTGSRPRVAAEAAVAPGSLQSPVAQLPDDAARVQLSITPREMEILALVAEGLSNREIGERLFVSENTVKTHCSRTFDKLGARRRTEAVQRARVLGILSSSPPAALPAHPKA